MPVLVCIPIPVISSCASVYPIHSFLFNPYQLSMAPRTRGRHARNLNHTLSGTNDTSLGDSTHASTVDQADIEGQPINPTYHQNNANGTSDTTVSAIHHRLITQR